MGGDSARSQRAAASTTGLRPKWPGLPGGSPKPRAKEGGQQGTVRQRRRDQSQDHEPHEPESERSLRASAEARPQRQPQLVERTREHESHAQCERVGEAPLGECEEQEPGGPDEQKPQRRTGLRGASAPVGEPQPGERIGEETEREQARREARVEAPGRKQQGLELGHGGEEERLALGEPAPGVAHGLREPGNERECRSDPSGSDAQCAGRRVSRGSRPRDCVPRAPRREGSSARPLPARAAGNAKAPAARGGRATRSGNPGR